MFTRRNVRTQLRDLGAERPNYFAMAGTPALAHYRSGTGRGEPMQPPNVVTASTSQLQKKFKHAADFGVAGTPNKANLQAFDDALRNHVQSPATQQIVGTYRGDPANIYVDSASRLAVIVDLAGNFLTGWKLSAQQLWHVLNGGNLGGR
jgi:hypothetical protein